MPNADDFLELFFTECDELLDSVATGLRAMDDGSYDMETVHAVFRGVHSMKGGAAAFGLTALVAFAHKFETALDLLRSNALDLTPQVMAVFHRCSDCLADLVEAARREDSSDHAQMQELLDELGKLIGSQEEPEDQIVFVPMAMNMSDITPILSQDSYAISLQPDTDLYRTGNDPAALIKALEKLGTTHVTLNADQVPVLADWSRDQPGLKWDIDFRTDAPEHEIESVFEFVEDCCKLSITAVDQSEAQGDCDIIRPSAAAGHGPHETRLTSDPVSAADTGGPETAGPRPAPGTEARAQVSSAKAAETAFNVTIRVGLDRVDRLMNMIGELVIKEAMLTQVIQAAGLTKEPEVAGALDGLRQLAGEIQESVMAIRAQPLKQVFQRMHRIVREAADATGKQVRVVTQGEQTEVDKTMIERLIEPLTHMIRNSVDHGLEDAVTRQRNGKPLEGVITLSAAHKSGRVQIEVSDDGGGINRTRVRQIAEEKGLVTLGASLTPGEIDSLLFLPGFSSKTEVSALSGRGVGLDVVRREITALGGRVMISSSEGNGTTFTITLPLTLAVLEGMLIQLNDQTMILPITAVLETLRPDQATLCRIGRSGRALQNRGELIPILDLACHFGVRQEPARVEDSVLIVVEADNRKRAAFQVDAIFDQRQVVIKSLEENYGRVPGVSAATILGDGKIALIIDPEELIQTSTSDPNRERIALVANG
ncbi:chemotaxis protein CheA [Natronohydrobacter thiooxidans]|uniref:chemotaxis protein CheA n=1 Tax=Natronohydrobacter thiooxidans TaxID=87172 RepID=UPI0008FF768A|nr:chemotaxis protein CheA [Natronohydrobacter thiooxidans]